MKDRPERNPFAGKGWIIQGLVWGAFMFIIMGIVYPLVEKEALTAGSLARALVLWLVAGLVYGWAMKHYMRWYEERKRKRQDGGAVRG
ncbi:MAG: hypothetical protein J5I62_09745 [Flavobacteriales bacterium]|nr:hypothetical protein [Flavobacteriales bacterium]MEB2342416.1 hypothetical protein [Flavobacteriia bacterium]